jgi:hypothetical protein
MPALHHGIVLIRPLSFPWSRIKNLTQLIHVSRVPHRFERIR